jgi:hypothetical protein
MMKKNEQNKNDETTSELSHDSVAVFTRSLHHLGARYSSAGISTLTAVYERRHKDNKMEVDGHLRTRD